MFEHYLKEVFHYLPANSVVKDAMYYALLNPGKRVRSNLFFKTLNSLGISDSYYEIAACIEMIHTYSLIHDDLPAMDDANFRRGKPCVHKQFPESIAILSGDGLLSEAFKMLAVANLNDHIKVKILNEVSDAIGCNGMIYGQELDLIFENQMIDQMTLEKLHQNKTGKMIMLPVRLALIIAEKTELLTEASDALLKYGLAFQVKDDLLDLGDRTLLGKDSSDLEHNKSTYPKLLGIENAQKYYEQLLNESYQMIQNILPNSALSDYMESLAGRTF